MVKTPNPLSFKDTLKNSSGFDTIKHALSGALKQPYIGVTQGGSSRTRGAKVAATTADAKPNK